ncbi:BppU family phage baseplate upper protein [Mammaliicoccus vitulinus]|uniref:BppU family phage baseplate upper protein n=1 Tax=Mammaliicoccus vitulinus TaxID=71237 RepID=UPI00194E464E|nr:BppU family phage baseplate upper protein [Mammaliicoccus vitulinus]MBM6628552.1 BppU family phage baseplate upper protein [Mammaliicoccus vitulinus]
MNNGIEKTGIFKLKSEPYLKPISDLGIGFYNLDENTATLRFNLYNTTGPILLGEENLKVYGYFESRNGSVSGALDLNIVDGMNGIVEVTLDKEFLQASTDTIVDGQLYIGVNNVDNKPEYNEVAVLGKFTFEVDDSLINKVSSFTKIEYIRMFDKLKEQIQQRVYDIEQAIANGEDYVAEMKNTLTNGKIELNNIITDGINNINGLINQYKQDVLTLKNTAETNINTYAADGINNINTVSINAQNEIEVKTNEAITHVDEKMIEFNSIVDSNGFLTPQEADDKITSLNWQKYVLTDENGRHFTTPMSNDMNKLHALEPGNYYATSVPISNASSTSGFINVSFSGSGTVKHIVFKPYNSTQIYLKRFYNEWSDWERVGVPTNTGWLSLTLRNGATQAVGDYPLSTYRVIDYGTHKEIDLRLSVSNISENSVIAFIPQIFTDNEFHNFLGITNNQNAIPRISINKVGDISFNTHPTGIWNDSDILIIETSWKI